MDGDRRREDGGPAPAGLVAPGARLVDAPTGEVLAGGELADRLAAVAGAYRELPAGPVFACSALDVPSVVRYLGAVEAHRPVALLDPGLAAETLTDLVTRYEPAAVTGVAADAVAPKDYRASTVDTLGISWIRETAGEHTPHPDLAVLLATSGSTGDPKLVRLSRSGLLHNAGAIGTVLGIDADEVAITSLPLFYSYGMSVVNSHLAAGATVVVADGGVLSKDFWAAVDRYGVTSLGGVPYHYEMLHRIRWSPAKHRSLRVLTQAGGRLRPELITAFHEKIAATGGRFHVMWGQTEAGPRMSTLPAEALPSKVGSVGPALPGGRLAIRADDGTETTEPGVTGEVVYRGPNVMMGYALTAADLAGGDELGGVLATGDVGRLDGDGHLWLSGRLKRFGKVFGIRLNLDDIEGLLRDAAPVAAVAGDDKVVVYVEPAAGERRAELVARLADQLRLHRTGFDVRVVDSLPLLANGKVDYRALEASGG
jgi:acyl-coenzyme A synthetase/AMP-(fatty) acid ligase